MYIVHLKEDKHFESFAFLFDEYRKHSTLFNSNLIILLSESDYSLNKVGTH